MRQVTGGHRGRIGLGHLRIDRGEEGERPELRDWRRVVGRTLVRQGYEIVLGLWLLSSVQSKLLDDALVRITSNTHLSIGRETHIWVLGEV